MEKSPAWSGQVPFIFFGSLTRGRRFGSPGGGGAGSLGGVGAGSLGGGEAGSLGGGGASARITVTVCACRSGGIAFATVANFAGFEFCGTTVMVVPGGLARNPGCPSRLEPARSQGLPIMNPCSNFPNKLASACDSVEKSQAWAQSRCGGLSSGFSHHDVRPLRV